MDTNSPEYKRKEGQIFTALKLNGIVGVQASACFPKFVKPSDKLKLGLQRDLEIPAEVKNFPGHYDWKSERYSEWLA